MDKQIWTPGRSLATYNADQALRKHWFELIAPRPNWKMPIDTIIEQAAFADCDQAAVFFTGGGLTIVSAPAAGLLHVKGAGYYANIGA